MDKVSEVERSGQQTLAALSTLDAIKVGIPTRTERAQQQTRV